MRPAATTNPNANPWNEADRLYIGLWIKNGDTNSNRQPMRVSALVTNTSDQRSLNWVIGSGSFSDTSTCKYLSNYATYNDGGWHYVELDLKGQLASKGETIKKVNGLVLRGADLYVDDVVLSGGVMVTLINWFLKGGPVHIWDHKWIIWWLDYILLPLLGFMEYYRDH